jgi:tRNA1(Val) A37 N6-methylase TrmN6
MASLRSSVYEVSFETPEVLASALARHAPRHIKTILEPAVGRGDLLQPFVMGHEREITQVVCIDNDSAAIKHVKSRFNTLSGEQLRLVTGDFLEWHRSDQALKFRDHFDCVVMNPPFKGRMTSVKRIDGDLFLTQMNFASRAVPIEIAFFAAAIQLVRSGGTILAIVPASTISAESTAWFRKYLLEIGAIRFVHELPRRSFPGVDGVFYFVVFERARNHHRLRLANHSLTNPEILNIRAADIKLHLRLDYAFNLARLRQLELTACRPDLSWTPLHRMAAIHRGRIPAPFKTPCLHSTSFVGQKWVVPNRFSANGHLCALPGDLLVVRVARRCYDSFSLFNGTGPVPCSDCLLIIRPHNMASIELLFALRVLLASQESASLILHGGTGAKYMTVSSLREVMIPSGLSEAFRKPFLRYRTAVNCDDREGMLRIEDSIRCQLATQRPTSR